MSIIWQFTLATACFFGLIYARKLYRFYHKADEDKKPRIMKIYLCLLIASIILFMGIRFAIGAFDDNDIPTETNQQQLIGAFDDNDIPTETNQQ